MLCRCIDDLCIESIGQTQCFRTRLTLASHLDQRKLTFNWTLVAKFHSAMGHINHAVHWYDTLKLMTDLIKHIWRAARNNRNARQVLLVLGFRNRKAFNIVATT
ncbi:hypothetical protein D9M69_654840 [compost metagenome]